MLKPMHIYVKYKVTVRKKTIIDDNDSDLESQCDAFKAEVRRKMDKVVHSKFDYDNCWIECDVDADEV